jgi:hypothetical protein
MDEYYYERRYLKIRNAYDRCDFVKLSKILSKYTSIDRFVWACLEGDLVNAKRLYENGGLSIRMSNDCLLKYACKYNGNLPMIMWLIEKGNVETYPDLMNEMFKYACFTGKHDLAIWLYERGGIDIHVDGDLPFRYSIIRGHLTIAYWLYTLYNYVVDDNCKFLEQLWWLNGDTEKYDDIFNFVRSLGIDTK